MINRHVKSCSSVRSTATFSCHGNINDNIVAFKGRATIKRVARSIVSSQPPLAVS